MTDRCPNCDLGVVVDDGSRCDAGCNLRPADLDRLVSLHAVVDALRQRYDELEAEHGPPNPTVESAADFVERTFGDEDE